MTTFTKVMAVLMAMIALGQLAINIAMLRKNRRKAIGTCALRILFFVWSLIGLGGAVYGFAKFYTAETKGAMEAVLFTLSGFSVFMVLAFWGALMGIALIDNLEADLNQRIHAVEEKVNRLTQKD